jgi:hypothetical protein
MEVKPKLKQKWIDALRSGKYQQGNYALRNNQGQYCCLGVLADVCGVEWSNERIGGVESNYWHPTGEVHKRGVDAYYSTSGLSLKFRELVGLPVEEHDKLITMNDSGTSFEQIADYIQRSETI